MKKFLIVSLLIAAVFVACDFSDLQAMAKKVRAVPESGKVITKTFSLSDFDELEVLGSFKVKLVQRQGKAEAVVEGSDNVIEGLNLNPKNHKLKIRFKQNLRFKYKKLNITVYTPSISKVAVSGSGNIEFADGLKTDDLKCEIAGSGVIKGMDVVSNNIKCEIAGSGTIKLAKIDCRKFELNIAGSGLTEVTGKADEVEFDIAGSGDIRAIALEAQKGKIEIAGSGNIQCNVVDLERKVIGGGKIRNAKD